MMTTEQGRPFRVLVTGSRSWKDRDLIHAVLARLLAEHGRLIVVHGAAVGADLIANDWAAEQPGAVVLAGLMAADYTGDAPVVVEPHPVTGLDWGRYGRGAGHRRNAEMVALGADLCVAFIRDGSAGATGCARMAAEAGIPVRRYEQNGDEPVKLRDLPPSAATRRRLLRTMTQDSIDMGLYDTTTEQLAGTVNTDTPHQEKR